jgi:CHAD domain-containing protein
MRATSEHELKLDAPAGFRLPPLGGSPLTPRVFTSVYYDVPGGSLADGGITLRRRTENGHGVWQLKLPAEDSRLELEAEGGPGQPPEALLALLHAHLRRGPLERVAELRTHRSGELVARNGTTAEVTADEVTVLDSSEASNHFVEVEIELREGDPDGLDEIAGELVSAGAEQGEGLPKLFRALGRTAAHGTSQRFFEELQRRLRAQLREIERHDPGTRLGRDPESLHDMRVGVRRLRALLRAGKELVATDTGELDERLKQLGQILGEVRDLDVLLARLDSEAAELGGEDAKRAGALLAVLRTERSCSRSRLLAALRSDQYLALLDDTARTIEELEPSGSTVTLDELSDEAFARLRRAVRKLPDLPADEELHAVRKKGKRARYAAELAGQKHLVKQAKKLQDVLGEHQDAVVAAERLRKLAVAAAPEQALAAGRLVEREEERRLEARAHWPKTWKKLRKQL